MGIRLILALKLDKPFGAAPALLASTNAF